MSLFEIILPMGVDITSQIGYNSIINNKEINTMQMISKNKLSKILKEEIDRMNNSLTNVNKDLKKEEVRKLLKTKDFGKWTKKVKERA
jgi:hypothetical protein